MPVNFLEAGPPKSNRGRPPSGSKWDATIDELRENRGVWARVAEDVTHPSGKASNLQSKAADIVAVAQTESMDAQDRPVGAVYAIALRPEQQEVQDEYADTLTERKYLRAQGAGNGELPRLPERPFMRSDYTPT